MLYLFSITYFQIFEKYENWKNEKCPKQPLCYRSQFLVSEDPLFLNLYGNMFSSTALFDYFCRLSLKNQMSEAITTEKSYSGQSLFGDIGGTLNMFLGFCGLGIIEIIITSSNLCGKRLRRTVIKCAVFFFWLVFVFFSTQAIVKFRRQPITTQTHFVKNNLTNEFPYLTFCAKSYSFTFKPFYHQLQELLEKLGETNMTNQVDFDELLDQNNWPSDIVNTHSGIKEVQDLLHTILNVNADLNFNEPINWSYDIKDVIREPSVTINEHKLYLQGSEIWSKTYHERYGLCYTLDIR